MKLEELKALCDAATPGPWEPAMHSSDDGRWEHANGPTHDGCSTVGDAAFIAAARNMIPKLIAVVEAAQAVQWYDHALPRPYFIPLREAIEALEKET